ncbi:HNH endonuclease signature motif containing protein [Vibrio fortis]
MKNLQSTYKNYSFFTLNKHTLRVMRDDGYFTDISVGEQYRTQRHKVLVNIVSLQDQYHDGKVGYYLKSTPVNHNENRGKDITAHGILDSLISGGAALKVNTPEFLQIKSNTLKTVNAQIKVRTAQSEFRKVGLSHYGACVVTGTTLQDTLEAAHIEPINGNNDMLSNCLILRSDWHKLFDKHLWSINPYTNCVELSESMKVEKDYAHFHGQQLNIVANISFLKSHYKAFKSKLA